MYESIGKKKQGGIQNDKISEILEIGSNKKYIDNLIKECKKENIIPFIGAGMSVPIYELWGDFFNRCV